MLFNIVNRFFLDSIDWSHMRSVVGRSQISLVGSDIRLSCFYKHFTRSLIFTRVQVFPIGFVESSCVGSVVFAILLLRMSE